MTTDLVLDALEMGIWQRATPRPLDPGAGPPLRRRLASTPRSATPNGSPRPALGPRSGRSGDSYDNAMAESVIGLFKTELIRRRGPWRGLDAVEIATLEWVDWFNNRRLFEAIGNIPPAEAEANHYRTQQPSETLQMAEPSLH